MVMQCPVHKVDLVCFCPACRGAVTSVRKARSSRHNGMRGGRPRLSDEEVSLDALYQRARRERMKQKAAKALRKKKGVR